MRAIALLLCFLAVSSAFDQCGWSQPSCQASVPAAVTSSAQRVTPRKPAPKFTANAVVDEQFTKVSLDDYLGSYLVLFFYPFDFTYVCPTELTQFSDRIDEFTAIGAKVVAVSTDSHHTHLAWIRTPRNQGGLGSMKIPLVADISKTISRDYGVLVEDASDPMYGAALRGLFVIDPQGTVRSIQINDDQVGRNVDETLRLIKAFKFADENGTVCPAGWKPGDATIKPDQREKMEYFNKVFGK
eukprot:GILI01001202.1.p2 GENE.GILI01001202.1~~GILI01001202.1.p2  ORF type:complete len:242 (-),score=98.74 GILI01001202.1:52-777(-)